MILSPRVMGEPDWLSEIQTRVMGEPDWLSEIQTMVGLV